MAEVLRLPSNVLSQWSHKITRRNWGEKGRTYIVEGVPCEHCKACNDRLDGKGNRACTGMSNCSSIAGGYKDGDLYGAGYRHALDAVFGAYTDKDKTAVKPDSWMVDYNTTRAELDKVLASIGQPTDGLLDVIKMYRQEVEKIPTPGEVARNFGTEVHAAIEEILKARQKDEETFIDTGLAQSSIDIVEWLDKNEFNVMDVEVAVYHPGMGYAGTIDCVAERHGNISLFDWKTGGLYNNAMVQLAGYGMAYREITGIEPTALWAIRSNRGNFTAHRVADISQAKLMFGYLMAVKLGWGQLAWAEGG